jgi:putative ABC transport system permease protein
MRTLRSWTIRFAGLFGHTKHEREFDAELESHVALATDRHLRNGLNAQEARRRALLELGGVQAVRESHRDRRSVPWLEHLAQDVRYGARILMRNPGFTSVALLALALGIGANTALFSAIYSVLLQPLPYADANHLVVLKQHARANDLDMMAFSAPEMEDIRAQSRTMDQVEEYHGMYFILLGRTPDRVQTGVVSAGFFPLLGVKPLLGRVFQPSDDKKGAPPVLVLSYQYWQKAFGGDPKIVGKTFKMNDKLHTVVGVLPPIPQYPRENDVYMPISACPWRSNEMHRTMREMRMMRLIGHLKPGQTVEGASADMHAISMTQQHDYPKDYPARLKWDASAGSLLQQITEKARPILLLLLGVAGLVLLICCTNVANLALARIVRREHEFALRAAVGASPGRLMQQVLTESILLALAGGGLGLILASFSLDVLVKFTTLFTTRATEIRLSTPVLLFTLALSLLTSVLFGSLPALTARRGMRGLKLGSSNTTAQVQGDHFRNGLIVAEVMLSFVMLTAAGLMIRTLIKLQSVDAGFNAEHVVTMQLPFDWAKYDNDDKTRAYEDRITRAVSALAGVSAAGLMSQVPLDTDQQPGRNAFIIDNHPLDPSQPQPVTNVMQISPEAFGTLGIPILHGRGIAPSDRPDRPRVVVISQSLAKHYFGNDDPIGHHLSAPDGKNSVEVIGVAGDTHQFGLDHEPVDTVYAPLAQAPGGGSLVLRAKGDSLNLVTSVRRAIQALDPEQAIVDVRTLDELRDASIVQQRVTAVLLGLFAALALIVAVTGLAGVTAFLVSRRTREIGIRLALGAQAREVMGMILIHGARLLLIGSALGLAASLLVGRALQKLLFEINPVDVLTLVSVSLVLIGCSLAATYLPARRATRVDPMVALRCD